MFDMKGEGVSSIVYYVQLKFNFEWYKEANMDGGTLACDD